MAAEPDHRLNALTEAVTGAAIEVHKHLGPGFQEATYETALSLELASRHVPVERQLPIELRYKGHKVGLWRIDMLVAGRLVVELKSVRALNDAHRKQLITYLKTLELSLGLLISFNVPILALGVSRVVHGEPHS